MKKIILILGILVFIFVGGCGITGNVVKEIVCNKPYIHVGTGCCLDKDDNSICDKDENGIDISKDNAEKEALRFAKTWESEDYGSLYEFFTPELQSKKIKSEFIKTLKNTRIVEDVVVVRLDDIKILDDKTALVYFHITGYYYFSRFGEEIPAFEMKFIDGIWKFNAFAGIFNAECIFDTDCSPKKEDKKECESKDITKFTKPTCKDYKCSFECISYGYFKETCSIKYADTEKEFVKEEMCKKFVESQKSRLNIEFIDDNGFITIKNLEDKKLTDVVITFNGIYTLDKGILGAKEEYTFDKTFLKKENGNTMGEKTPIEFVYFYSNEGRWSFGIDWEYLTTL